jgi:hypothetical protein
MFVMATLLHFVNAESFAIGQGDRWVAVLDAGGKHELAWKWSEPAA